MPSKSRKRARKSTAPQSIEVRSSSYWAWGLVIVTLLFVAAIRIRLLQIPLERDEGEFAYMGQLILQGIPPYCLAYNMKLPGIYGAYALIMAVFGQTIGGIHLGLLLVNSISIVLVFLLARRLFDPLTGVVACASFAFLSVTRSLLGTSAHATQFVLPFALGGILLMLKAIDSDKPRTLFWSGLLLGLAFIMKQHAAFFILFAGLYFLWSHLRTRPVAWTRLAGKTVLFLLGAALPFGLTCLALYAVGVFERFWFWTFTYAREYVSALTVSDGWTFFSNGAEYVLSSFSWLWAIAAIGLTALVWGSKARSNSSFLVGFVVLSFLAVCPGFYFLPHYFVLFLPAAALLIGVAISSARQLLSAPKLPAALRTIPVLLFIAVLGCSVFQEKAFFFEMTPAEACRMMYGPNPFPESIEIAQYLKTHTREQDRIVVLGSEPQIYFYSQRHSATGYIYTYGLVEYHKYAREMQREMAEQIESARPKYVVLVDIQTSWLVREKSDLSILDWANEYCRRHYRTVGVADIISEDRSLLYWDDEIKDYSPSSSYCVYVLERRTTSRG